MFLEHNPDPYRPFLPTWRSPLYLSLRPIWLALESALASCRGRVVDIGCGMQPYRPMLNAALTQYTGVDREGELTNPTIVGVAEDLPLEDASFDVALSTMMLEHVVDPRRVLSEVRRVLRPGGRLILVVPSVWPAHEVPYDYWRFTRFGLEQLLREFGFSGSVVGLGGLWSTVGQMICLAIGPIRFVRSLVPFINLAAILLDRIGSREDLALSWFVDCTLDAPPSNEA